MLGEMNKEKGGSEKKPVQLKLGGRLMVKDSLKRLNKQLRLKLKGRLKTAILRNDFFSLAILKF